ncbi:DNA-binding protein [Vulcanisaeta thermophila]|uniref:DNA-binding protein n=1 Tax=Vulcanisaeta thermophila TaxID=867917 RepID=UPI000A561EF4|nr:DNA-binding protein [Vulcanisaeta thermophila]
MSDEERERILRRMMMEIMSKAAGKSVERRRELTRNDVIAMIRQITKGERANEIINNALELYGDTAVEVFKQLVQLHMNGQLGELQDHELYQILERLGMHIPLKTRIRIVRHGREESIGGD